MGTFSPDYGQEKGCFAYDAALPLIQYASTQVSAPAQGELGAVIAPAVTDVIANLLAVGTSVTKVLQFNGFDGRTIEVEFKLTSTDFGGRIQHFTTGGIGHNGQSGNGRYRVELTVLTCDKAGDPVPVNMGLVATSFQVSGERWWADGTNATLAALDLTPVDLFLNPNGSVGTYPASGLFGTSGADQAARLIGYENVTYIKAEWNSDAGAGSAITPFLYGGPQLIEYDPCELIEGNAKFAAANKKDIAAIRDENTPSHICKDVNEIIVNEHVDGPDNFTAAPIITVDQWYLMYMVTPMRDRNGITNINGNQSDKFAAVGYDQDTDTWSFVQQNQNALMPFTPLSGDILIAEINAVGAHTAFTADGETFGIPHVAGVAGLTVEDNTWVNGQTNVGEFRINGSAPTVIARAYLQMDGNYNTVQDGSGDALTVDQAILEGYVPCDPPLTQGEKGEDGKVVSGSNTCHIAAPSIPTGHNINTNGIIPLVASNLMDAGWSIIGNGELEFQGNARWVKLEMDVSAEIPQTANTQRAGPIITLERWDGTSWSVLTDATGYIRDFSDAEKDKWVITRFDTDPIENPKYRLVSSLDTGITGQVNVLYSQFSGQACRFIPNTSVAPSLTANDGTLSLNDFADLQFNGFRLSIQNTTNAPVNWEALLENKPYSTINNLPATVTLQSSQNVDGSYNHLLTSVSALAAFSGFAINIASGSASPNPQTITQPSLFFGA